MEEMIAEKFLELIKNESTYTRNKMYIKQDK